MMTTKMPIPGNEGLQGALSLPRLASMDGLGVHVAKCEPETLSQALNLYIAELEAFGLPESFAVAYMEMETLFAAARVLLDCGCPENASPLDLSCPGFPGTQDGFTRCCSWSYELLKRALEYRKRYSGRTGNPGIGRARYFIDMHYTDAELMLKDAAREAKMSTSRFSTVFAREMGRTFTEYVTDLRIGKACELLVETSMRIAQIAAQVGYNDPHYFSWIFRKSTGSTPTAYREQAQTAQTE